MMGQAALTDDDVLKLFLQGTSISKLVQKVKTSNEVTLPAAKGMVERIIYRHQMEEIKKSALPTKTNADSIVHDK